MKKNKAFVSVMLIAFLTILKSSSFAQNSGDTIKGQFHDDLLDHLVGKWNVTSIAHGFSSTAVIEAEWVLNHQFLHYRFKGNDTIPWLHVPMEFECFISYNHTNKRYIVMGASVFGVDDFEGFCYAYRNGNELKLIQKGVIETDPPNIQRWTWQPSSKSWAIQSRPEISSGKEGDIFLDMKLVKQSR